MNNSGLLFFSCFLFICYSFTLDCSEYGFNEDLSCFICPKIEYYTKDNDLVNICNECCNDDDKKDIKYADHILLTLGRYNERNFPHITEFIKKYSKNFPSLSIKYKQYTSPRLELFDNNNKLIDLIRIDHWKTEDINEFLTKTKQK